MWLLPDCIVNSFFIFSPSTSASNKISLICQKYFFLPSVGLTKKHSLNLKSLKVDFIFKSISHLRTASTRHLFAVLSAPRKLLFLWSVGQTKLKSYLMRRRNSAVWLDWKTLVCFLLWLLCVCISDNELPLNVSYRSLALDWGCYRVN